MVEDYIKLAENAYRNRSLKEALNYCDKVLKNNPDDLNAWLIKGHVLALSNEEPRKCYEKALENADKLLVSDRKNKDAWRVKGEALSGLGVYRETDEEIEERIVSKMSPKEYGVLSILELEELIKQERNKSMTEKEYFEKALSCFQQALELDQNDDEILVDMGETLLQLGRDNDALLYFDKAVKINPHNSDAWTGKGELLLWRMNRYNEAIGCYNTAIKENAQSAVAWDGKGVALIGLGRLRESLDCFNQAIKINPNFYRSWTNKGGALYKLGSVYDAIECYDKSLELNPDSANTLIDKATALNSVHMYDEAEKCCSNAIGGILLKYGDRKDYSPADRNLLAMGWSNKAGIAIGRYQMGDELGLTEAGSCISSALKADPNCKAALHNQQVYRNILAARGEGFLDVTKGGCFIATAAYGTPFAEEINILRNWRDYRLIKCGWGRRFIRIYYKVSPPIAKFIKKSEIRKAVVRKILMPIIKHIKNLTEKQRI